MPMADMADMAATVITVVMMMDPGLTCTSSAAITAEGVTCRPTAIVDQ